MRYRGSGVVLGDELEQLVASCQRLALALLSLTARRHDRRTDLYFGAIGRSIGSAYDEALTAVLGLLIGLELAAPPCAGRG